MIPSGSMNTHENQSPILQADTTLLSLRVRRGRNHWLCERAASTKDAGTPNGFAVTEENAREMGILAATFVEYRYARVFE